MSKGLSEDEQVTGGCCVPSLHRRPPQPIPQLPGQSVLSFSSPPFLHNLLLLSVTFIQNTKQKTMTCSCTNRKGSTSHTAPLSTAVGQPELGVLQTPPYTTQAPVHLGSHNPLALGLRSAGGLGPALKPQGEATAEPQVHIWCPWGTQQLSCAFPVCAWPGCEQERHGGKREDTRGKRTHEVFLSAPPTNTPP